MPVNPKQLAARIDHTLLRPDAVAADVDLLCDEAMDHGFAAVCVNPVWVQRCEFRLRGSCSGACPAICSVAGFPLGASLSNTKADEAVRAVEQGASEVDMVANFAALLSGDVDAAAADIAEVVRAVKARRRDGVIKVILETSALDAPAVVRGCIAALRAGADFVKTSTGFHASGGARLEDVRRLRAHAGSMRVKASGGIRTLEAALQFLDAGADRLGCSSSVAIVAAARG